MDAGVRQIQGTLNGLGERCGNANLTTLIPTLLLKEPYASAYETGVPQGALARLTKVSRMLDEILNRVPQKQAAYVGASAFAHKAGLHASAILKDPTTYEHIDPATVGNARIIPMSNQAGLSNLRQRLRDAGLPTDDAEAHWLEACMWPDQRDRPQLVGLKRQRVVFIGEQDSALQCSPPCRRERVLAGNRRQHRTIGIRILEQTEAELDPEDISDCIVHKRRSNAAGIDQ